MKTCIFQVAVLLVRKVVAEVSSFLHVVVPEVVMLEGLSLIHI